MSREVMTAGTADSGTVRVQTPDVYGDANTGRLARQA
jgi:hypothetical protein